MSKEIIAILDALCEKLGVAIDWTSANVMPYVEELIGKYISYEMATSIAWIVGIFVLFVISVLLTILCYNKIDENDYDDCLVTCFIVGFIASLFLGVALIFVIGTQTLDIITCVTFPEKMIIDYVKTLAIN